MHKVQTQSFAELLQSAVKEPGTLSRAYRQFHSYSLGNQLLAMFQCQGRGIALGPLATFPRWKELGRHVKRSEKALTLCMPLTLKRRAQSADDADAADSADSSATTFIRFVYRSRWFVLSQTEGEALPEPCVPTWKAERALATLDVAEIPFDGVDGNTMGYARERSIAINPLNPLPHKTLTVATQVQVYFCDPQSPWQRGTNENTNGLLRQYFPHGTNLASYTQAELNAVAQRLNSRPRKTLGYATPADRLANTLLLH